MTTNQLTGAEAMVRLLQQHGVEVVFGLCGDTSLPLYDALYRLDHDIRHVLTRDERSAGYMADVYARVSGKVGVCEGPSGGGATYILPAVVEANESSIAMLAITTDIGTGSRGRYTLTELDQEALFRPVTKWNRVIGASAALPRTVRRAFAEATSGRPGAVHLGLPMDVQKGPVDAEDVWGEPAHGRFPAHPASPPWAEIDNAAELLVEAKAPLILCGGGPVIAHARELVTALAERLGAVVATTISGQGAILDDHALALGVVGSNGGSAETRHVLDQADVILAVGCRLGSVTTERWRHPKPGVKLIHLDAEAAVIGANYPTAVGIVADARSGLQALFDAIDDRLNQHRRDGAEAKRRVAEAKASKFERFRQLAASTERPIRPERVVAAMAELLPNDAIVVADPGTPCPYLSAYLELMHPDARLISNRAHGALGYSLPGVLGAYYARPQAKCVAVMGDGSFGFNAGEMETLVRTKAPVTLVVMSNAVFGWIKAGQNAGFGQRFYSVDFERTDHAAVAQAFGVKSWRVEDPADVKTALAAAFAHDGPTLVDIVVQPLHEAAAPVTEWIA
ncbi:MAG: thiamine pyrophosphate-binding protein [Geminicoccaceae bacterium]|nr:MAG: thiamine pyrophosphate-binding protein [Geminicoccaceae bacterium]